MTAVPEKETEVPRAAVAAGAARRGDERADAPRARGRAPMAGTPEPAPNIIVLPGERLSTRRRDGGRARGDSGPSRWQSGMTPRPWSNGALDAEDGRGRRRRRRRRRRGGRGRGRGRAGRGPATSGARPGGRRDRRTMTRKRSTSSELPTPPQHSTFGSVWDSQIGRARRAAQRDSAAWPTRRGLRRARDAGVPPRRAAAAGPAPRGTGRRGRGDVLRGYQSAVDRERYRRGRRHPAARWHRGPRSGRGRPRPRSRRTAARRRRHAAARRRPAQAPTDAAAGPPREPWSEVPPEVQEMLRAELARKVARRRRRDDAPGRVAAEARRPLAPGASRSRPPAWAPPRSGRRERAGRRAARRRRRRRGRGRSRSRGVARVRQGPRTSGGVPRPRGPSAPRSRRAARAGAAARRTPQSAPAAEAAASAAAQARADASAAAEAAAEASRRTRAAAARSVARCGPAVTRPPAARRARDRDENPPHALLVGPRRVGKTTLALDLAAGLLCLAEDPPQRPCRACAACRKVEHGNHPDVHRIAPEGAGEQIRLGQVQALIAELALLPLEGRFRVAIVAAAQRLNPDAQNALLKTLEEPPAARPASSSAADDAHAPAPTPSVSRCARLRLGPLRGARSPISWSSAARPTPPRRLASPALRRPTGRGARAGRATRRRSPSRPAGAVAARPHRAGRRSAWPRAGLLADAGRSPRSSSGAMAI